jgi:hypothetical protein
VTGTLLTDRVPKLDLSEMVSQLAAIFKHARSTGQVRKAPAPIRRTGFKEFRLSSPLRDRGTWLALLTP